jgi:chromosome segregation ATPase
LKVAELQERLEQAAVRETKWESQTAQLRDAHGEKLRLLEAVSLAKDQEIAGLQAKVADLGELVKVRENDQRKLDEAHQGLRSKCQILKRRNADALQELTRLTGAVEERETSNARMKGRYQHKIRALQAANQAEVDRVAKDGAAQCQHQRSEQQEVERQLRATVADQNQEIHRLKDLLRKLSLNLEREEADNARLATKLQMTQIAAKGSCPCGGRLSPEIEDSP